MEIDDLIMELELLREKRGNIRVMVDHSEIATVSIVDECHGCPAYISIESE